MLESVPEGAERYEQELALQTALSVPLVVTTGYTSSEVERVFHRARDLCKLQEKNPQIFSVLYGLQRFSSMRGDFASHSDLAEQLQRVGQQTQDPASLLVVSMGCEAIYFWRGELETARTYFDQGLKLYDPTEAQALILRYGDDPSTLCGVWGSWILWLLGYPDQALRMVRDLQVTFDTSAHPVSLVMEHYGSAVLHGPRRDQEGLRSEGEALMTRTSAMPCGLHPTPRLVVR